jgi:hypothetical protein
MSHLSYGPGMCRWLLHLQMLAILVQSGSHVLARHTFDADACIDQYCLALSLNLYHITQHATLPVPKTAVVHHSLAVIRNTHRADFYKKSWLGGGIMPGPRKRPYSNIDFTLRKVFKKATFRYAPRLVSTMIMLNILRPPQREVVLATLEGQDVFVQAATSFGKSLCYQLPAVVDFGSM